VLGPLRRQAAKALRIVGGQLGGRPRRMLQGHRAHRRSIEREAVVLLKARTTLGKRMLAPKVTEPSLQSARLTSGTDPDPLRQAPQITMCRVAPDALLNLDLAKNTPPLQGFFFRNRTSALASMTSLATRSSARTAQSCITS